MYIKCFLHIGRVFKPTFLWSHLAKNFLAKLFVATRLNQSIKFWYIPNILTVKGSRQPKFKKMFLVHNFYVQLQTSNETGKK